jgi:hypothetical protein
MKQKIFLGISLGTRMSLPVRKQDRLDKAAS